MPYWQILPLPAMPCLQQEQVCYQHLLSPLPPHIILHQQTAGGSKQSVRRPTAFYRCVIFLFWWRCESASSSLTRFGCYQLGGAGGGGGPGTPTRLLWGGELCYSPRIQTWELSWGQLCSQSSCEVVAKSNMKRVLQNQLNCDDGKCLHFKLVSQLVTTWAKCNFPNCNVS